jgi:4-amino-4-deoxy-L-arabinose transferase-like glycosyltransferase
VTGPGARLRALSPWQASVALTALVALLHLLVAGRVALSADEAHYALYGLHPDWSYFDHPPLVGWLQAIVLRFSDSELALRLWPIALSAATALTLYRFAHRLFPQASPWLGFWSVAFYHSGLLFQAIGLALVPETPLVLLALLAMLALLDALDHGRVRDWLRFGLWLGLAGLAKYTGVTLALSALLFVLLQRRLTVLRTPGPWLAVLVAALLIAPVLYWNATHDWISFNYQLHHGFRPKDWDWSRAAVSQLGQLFAYAPGIYLFGLIALVAGLRAWRERGVQLTLLLVLPVLALFASGSGREETLPHWTALAWAGVAPLAARWLMDHWTSRAVRALAWFSAGYSVLLIAALHTLLLFPQLPLALPVASRATETAPARPDWGVALHAELIRWPQAAAQATELRAALAAEPGPEPVLFVPNWALASRLAWYARPLPVQVTDERFDQFDLWFGTPARGARGVLVAPARAGKALEAARARFAHCAEHAPLTVVARHRPGVTFRFLTCRDYRPPAS